jgi:hypothetical protein
MMAVLDVFCFFFLHPPIWNHITFLNLKSRSAIEVDDVFIFAGSILYFFSCHELGTEPRNEKSLILHIPCVSLAADIPDGKKNVWE